jgi:type II secretory pathway component PulK
MIRSSARGDRRGFMAVMLVLTLVVVTLLGGAMLRTAALRNADLRAAEHRLQAEWLAESGLARAVARLSSRADYRGETWEIPATEFVGRGDASVLIQVEPVAGKPDLRRVIARADYPKAESRRARETREMTIDLSIARKGEVRK